MKRAPSGSPSRIPTLVEESHDVPLVEIVIAAHAGSAGDAVGGEGALSLAFRSLRRGAGTRKAFEIDEAIDRLGSEFGASVDVSGASIHATVIRRKLEPFLDLFADLVLRPTFPQRELEQVILAEEFYRAGAPMGTENDTFGIQMVGNTILQWCDIDGRTIEVAAERNPDKFGARTLGTDIPIVSEEESRALRPDYYLVLPWHFRDEFLVRERAMLESGVGLIFPLPVLEIVRSS
ncbi:MAG: insulinase family protein, partial [Deltaproteobacteria bacterium]